MKIGFVYSGQGTQYVGMFSDLLKNSEFPKDVFVKCSELLNKDFIKLINFGPKEELDQPLYAQLAIISLQITLTFFLNTNEIVSEETCGLSLGEYGALYNSGSVEVEDLLHLIIARGKLMDEFISGDSEYKMIVILGPNANKVEKIVNDVIKQNKIIGISNYNSPTQHTVSGLAEDVDFFLEAIKKSIPDCKLIPIDVKVPSHTELLRPIKEAFAKKVNELKLTSLNQKFHSNYYGKAISKDMIKKGLVNQLTNSTRLVDNIRRMLDDGVNVFVEITPRSVLKRLIAEIAVEKSKKIIILVVKDLASAHQAMKNIEIMKRDKQWTKTTKK